MTARLILLSIAAALGGAVFAWALYSVVGGGGDDSPGAAVQDRRDLAILPFVSRQVEKLGGGADLVYDALDSRVQAECSIEEFVAAMADQPRPGAFREVKSITHHDDNTADVRVVLIGQTGDVEVDWRVSILGNGEPKILEVPGSEECTPDIS